MKRMATCLLFKDQAEQAARFYCSVFKDSRMGTIARYPASAARATGRPKGSVMTVAFTLNGQDFIGLNGGSHRFKVSPAISQMVFCRNQAEVDYYWNKLSAGGRKSVCGWLEDRYNLSWQIVPAELMAMHRSKDPEQIDRVMAAVITMTKLDVAALRRAYAGRVHEPDRRGRWPLEARSR